MKRGLKVLIIVLVILVVLAVAILLVKHFTTNEVNNELTGNSISYDNADAIATMDVVIVRVDDTYLEVINKDDPNDVMRANIPDDDINEYKQNQEVRVYYNGMINEMYPGSFDKVSKIEILKDNSDVTIPEKALKLFIAHAIMYQFQILM